MIEVEVKVAADHDDVRERLRELGAERQGVKTQRDTYYSAPHRDFTETDEAVRVRVEDGEAYLTYKGPKKEDGTKSRKEVEVGVGSAGEAGEVLESLGFREFGVVEKRRVVYELGDYEVALDDVEGVGEYVEVETEARGEDYVEARDGAVEILRRLGLDPGESVRESYLELLVENRG